MIIQSPLEIINHAAVTKLKLAKKEACIVFIMNSRNQIINIHKLGGTTRQRIDLDFRQILNLAKQFNGNKILLVHNHPSGHVEPSWTDMQTTRDLIVSARIAGIELVDHLIISSDDSVYSFQINRLDMWD